MNEIIRVHGLYGMGLVNFSLTSKKILKAIYKNTRELRMGNAYRSLLRHEKKAIDWKAVGILRERNREAKDQGRLPPPLTVNLMALDILREQLAADSDKVEGIRKEYQIHLEQAGLFRSR